MMVRNPQLFSFLLNPFPSISETNFPALHCNYIPIDFVASFSLVPIYSMKIDWKRKRAWVSSMLFFD